MHFEVVETAVLDTPGTTALPRQKDGLDISPADDGYIIYEPEKDRVHFLNPTAVLILEFCDGSHSPAQIAELLKEAYGLPAAPIDEVSAALMTMRREGLLVQEDLPQTAFA